MTEEKLDWWGYLHTSGDVQAKRYHDERDIEEAKERTVVRYIVEDTPEARKARDIMDSFVNQALLKHTKTHLMIFAPPTKTWEEIFDEAVARGYYNGKTITYKTPKGTITFHATVGCQDD